MNTSTLLLLILLSSSIFSCSDSSSVEPAPTLVGKWQWQVTTGGIGGWTYTPDSEGYTCILFIQSMTNCTIYRNDTLLQTGNCSLTTNDSITYIFDLKTGFTDSTLVKLLPHVVLTSASNSFDIAMRRSGDSLYVWDHNVADGFESRFIRIK